MSRSLLALLPLALAPAGPPLQDSAPAAQESVAPRGVELVFLANDGFHLRTGPYNVLIDAFLRDPYGIYSGLPVETFRALALGKAPYDGQALVLISHSHPDHVQYRGLERFLESNNQALLVSDVQVLGALKESARDFKALEGRLSSVNYNPGTAQKLVLIENEMSVTFLPMRHVGDANSGVHNLGHLIEIGGLTVLHVGDAEPASDNFRPYDLAKKQVDIAIVPFWYFGSEEAVKVLREDIAARHVVAAHVPPSELEDLKAHLAAEHPDVILFDEAMQSRRFE